MWIPSQASCRQAVLDFSSSGQDDQPVTQILLDGELFSNAAELAEWGGSSTQSLVCEHCGCTRCATGNWISFRRAGDPVVVLPAFREMYVAGRERPNFGPPRLLLRRGALLLEPGLYRQLLPVLPGQPDQPALAPLSGADVVELLQFEAPANALARFPQPARARREIVEYVSEGLVDELLDQLDATLAGLAGSATPMRLVPCAPPVPTFYLETRPPGTWRPLAHTGGEWRLHLEPGRLAVPEA